MKPNNRDLQVLGHMVEYCEDLSLAQKRIGTTFEEFKQDRIYRHACCLCLIQIGELVGHLSLDFKRHYCTIPWQQIKSLRNIVTHNYGNLDIMTTWLTITEDVPALKQFCKTTIKEHEKSQIQIPPIPSNTKDEDELER